MATLMLEDGSTFTGESFGAHADAEGEVVFTTGMVGYTESLTDPSYRGQILVFTYPLIGNYGVPSQELSEWGFSKNFESELIHVRGVIVAQASGQYSHHAAVSSLHSWLEHHGMPAITGIDTRALTKRIREHGVMAGKIMQRSEKNPGEFVRGSDRNLVSEVSCKEVHVYQPSGIDEPITVLAYDCGIKRSIIRSFLARGVRVVRVPWDFDFDDYNGKFDGIVISNGPGDPKMCSPTIEAIKKGLKRDIPTFGICLGNQLLALAIGADTYKLKYGHRSLNQPCIEVGSEIDGAPRCIITSQNHGYAVKDELPPEWRVSYRNANDGSIEGIRHDSGRFFAVQFHPEASPGPEDASDVFDEFISVLKAIK